VARWYRGELPREQLQREPQMWRTQTFVPTPPAVAREALAPLQATLALTQPSGDRAVSRALLPAGESAGRGGVGGPVSASPSSAAPLSPGAGMPGAPSAGPFGGSSVAVSGGEARDAGMATPGASSSDSAPPARVAQEPLHESLQGLVRHQLEMLVTPVLRWEGDVWSGVFMALVMHLPQVEREGRESQDEEAARKERERQGWRSTMTLQVAGLGEVGVDLWLRESRLDLDLVAAEASVRESLELGVDRLTPRLEACGLTDVRVRIAARGGEAR
ncbi:MAG TPA: flagellar hook-length control protein FliK, partial [Halomonas sp.]|nr:flagellar hook-length control protein FliK [Halomonas sp.]